MLSDRLLARFLWLVIMSLIVGSAGGALIMLYSGLFKLITRQFDTGGLVVGTGVVLGVICWILCKHSDDLIDRRA